MAIFILCHTGVCAGYIMSYGCRQRDRDTDTDTDSSRARALSTCAPEGRGVAVHLLQQLAPLEHERAAPVEIQEQLRAGEVG